MKRSLTALCTLAALSLLPASVCPSAELARDFFPPGRRNVLVLQSYHVGMRWTDNVTRGIMSVFGEPESQEFDVRFEFMDTKRKSDDIHFAMIAELFREKFKPNEFDAIITVDDDAFNFVRHYRAGLFGETPVVFCGVNYFRPEMLADFTNCTGVVEAYDLVSTLDLALRLHPRATKVYVINDETVTGVSNRKRVDEIAPQFAGRADFVHLHNMTMEELLPEVENIPPDSVLLLMSFNRDRARRMFRYRDAARLICPKSPVPVYAIWDFYLGDGVVGGKVTSGVSQGEMAARMAAKILAGERVQDLPVVTESPNVFMFDHRQLERWGISRSQLPPDSIILHEPPVFYEISRETLWVAVIAIGILGGLSLVLAIDVSVRKRVQRELENANRQLKREMTEREETQRALRESEEQLRQSQKLEALGRLAGGVAHDFNNLLMSVIGFSRLAQEKLKPDDPAREDLEEVVRAGERAAGVTKQLLALGRRQMLDIRSVDLNTVVGGMDRLLRHTLGEDIELETIPGLHLPMVKGDAGYLEQVVLNLAVNARDAMPRGGRLSIGTWRVVVEPGSPQNLAGTEPGPYVCLTVRDTGEGMTPEVRRHAMEPFFTTKEKGEGSGLGLAVVYGIVKQFSGHVEIDSEPGRGTEVRVYLKPADDLESSLVEQKPLSAPRGTETVLVAEDEELVRRFVVRVLTMQGYRVLEAANGNDALNTHGPKVGTIDLLVTDMVMPQMGGRELARKFRAIRRDLKVLYMTGFAHEVVEEGSRAGGGDPIILKPCSMEALAQKVREVLDQDSARG